MLSNENNKEQITELKASYLYLKYVFDQSKGGWEGIKEAIEKYNRQGYKIVHKVISPTEKLALSVIGINTNAILNYSPLFQNNRNQATRIEHYVLFSLLSDFSNILPWSPEETLTQVRHWQRLDNKLVKELKQIGKNPFGDLAGYFLCELFGDNVIDLCQKGTTNIDHFILSIIADLYTLLCSNSFLYWKKTIDNYILIRERDAEEFLELNT